MFRVICFCDKHNGMNIYWPMKLELAQKVQKDYPGYRVIIYEG